MGLSENMVPQISPLITMFPSHIAIPAGVYPIFQTSKSYVAGYIPSNFPYDSIESSHNGHILP